MLELIIIGRVAVQLLCNRHLSCDGNGIVWLTRAPELFMQSHAICKYEKGKTGKTSGINQEAV